MKSLKLVVVIPAYNESSTIGSVIQSIPRVINGVDRVEVLLVDDGSSDNTVQVALGAGANLVVAHKENRGVGASVKTGIHFALQAGADVICLIDGDEQFRTDEIPRVVDPIVSGEADLVIGDRFHSSDSAQGIPYSKRIGNKIVASFMRWLVMWPVSDAESGFRALSRKAATNLRLLGCFTATHDMLLDLISQGFNMIHVPVQVRYYKGRESRAVGFLVVYAIGVLGIVIMKLVQMKFTPSWKGFNSYSADG